MKNQTTVSVEDHEATRLRQIRDDEGFRNLNQAVKSVLDQYED